MQCTKQAVRTLVAINAVWLFSLGCGPKPKEKAQPVFARQPREAHGPSEKVADSPLLRWNLETTVNDYKRIGHRDPKWDETAMKALQLAAARNCRKDDEEDEFAKWVGLAAKGALEAGCRDPLVKYYYLSFRYDTGEAELAGIDGDTCHSALEMEQSGYSRVRKFWPYLRAARELRGGRYSAGNTADKMMAAALEHLKELIKDKSVPDAEVFRATEMQLDTGEYVTKKYGGQWPQLESLWFTWRSNTVDAWVLKAKVLKSEGWDARGKGYANTVTEEGWRILNERHMAGEESLRQAMKIDPADARPPTEMLSVLIHTGRESEVESWFKRAMTADPNNSMACYVIVHYSQPQWGGSKETMLKLGRTCAMSKEWGDKVVRVLLHVHERLWQKEKAEDRLKYYQKPEVWADVKLVFDELTRRDPSNLRYREEYMAWAGKCGQYEVVNEQLKIRQSLVATASGQRK